MTILRTRRLYHEYVRLAAVLAPIVLTVLVPVTGLLFTPVGPPVLSWLAGNPVGRVGALIGIVVMLSWMTFRIGQSDGVTRVQAEQRQLSYGHHG